MVIATIPETWIGCLASLSRACPLSPRDMDDILAQNGASLTSGLERAEAIDLETDFEKMMNQFRFQKFSPQPGRPDARA